jgi:hypothetical protein
MHHRLFLRDRGNSVVAQFRAFVLCSLSLQLLADEMAEEFKVTIKGLALASISRLAKPAQI